MPAIDDSRGKGTQLESPASNLALVVPDDDADLDFVTRGIALAAAGALKITTLGGQTLTIPSGALSAGGFHAIRATRVWADETTATGIVAAW